MKHIKKRYVIIGMLIIAAAAGALFIAQYAMHSTSNQTEATAEAPIRTDACFLGICG